MADLGTHIHTVEKATWDTSTSGKADVTIDGITAFSFNNSGSEQTLVTDGNTFPTFGWIENIVQGAMITTNDLNLLGVTDNLLEQGDVGTLSLYAPARSAMGYVGSGSVHLKIMLGVAAETHCMIETIDINAAQSGPDSGSISFSLETDDGITDDMAITAIASGWPA